MVDLFGVDSPRSIPPIQWNFVTSRPDTLRGVHVHPHHTDYFCVLSGSVLLGLNDMRVDSATYRRSAFLTLLGEQPCAIVIPPGVAHGFYFAEAADFTYAVDYYWNPADELGCRWDDPDLDLVWPTTNPLLSPRDANAPSYAALAEALANAMAQHNPS